MGVVGLEADLVHADDVAVPQAGVVVEDAAEHVAGHVARRRVGQGRCRGRRRWACPTPCRRARGRRASSPPGPRSRRGAASGSARGSPDNDVVAAASPSSSGTVSTDAADEEGRVGRRRRHLRRRPDVHVDDGRRSPRRPGRTGPTTAGVVHRRQPQLVGVLAEAHGVAALVGAAADLLRGQLGVPQRDQRERDQPAAALTAAPVVDHPVVVGLHAERGRAPCPHAPGTSGRRSGAGCWGSTTRPRRGWCPCRPGARAASRRPGRTVSKVARSKLRWSKPTAADSIMSGLTRSS